MIPPLHFDMYQTIGLAVLALLLGSLLRHRIKWIDRFCIPSPVVGGLVFSLLTCLLYVLGVAEAVFDDTLMEFFMVLFFASMGFQADFRQLKNGGRSLFRFLFVVILLIVMQNALGMGLAMLTGQSALTGLTTGSISMVGGHGTAAAFGPLLEDKGLSGATTFCSAAATFGLIAGSLLGGPLGDSLIRRKDLLKTASPASGSGDASEAKEDKSSLPSRYGSRVTLALFQILIAIGLGTLITSLLKQSGLPFPVYIGAMLAAAAIRNISILSKKYTVYMEEISGISDISLGLFLGMAMISLKLWQLADLAIPLMVMLLGQTLLMLLFARFVIFPVMGKDYDAAVMTAGACGSGMGATPNAMANARTLCRKYAPSPKAFFLLPLVGCVFTDLFNSLILSLIIKSF